jgi:hypothetical protein
MPVLPGLRLGAKRIRRLFRDLRYGHTDANRYMPAQRRRDRCGQLLQSGNQAAAIIDL